MKALKSIRVRPNFYNKILISDSDFVEPELNGEDDKLKYLPAHLDAKIIHTARQIVVNNSLDDESNCDIEHLNKRITKMENMLELIVDKLNNLIHKPN